MKKAFICCLSAFLLLVFVSVYAGVPRLISYQGMLLQSDGSPVADGQYLIRFNIYNDPVAGTELWSSSLRGILVTDGLFSYNLGDTVALPNTIFAGDTNLWLGIKVGVDPEMTPRSRLTSNSFTYQALKADSASYASYAASIPDNSVTSSKIVDGTVSGNDVDNNQIQLRVYESAPAGQAISSINSDGSIVSTSVGIGDITGVTAGTGLTGGGTSGSVTLSADVGYLQRRVTGSAGAGEAITAINSDGTITASSFGDITAVTAGSGLSGGGSSGDLTLNLAPTVTSDHIFNGIFRIGDSTLYGTNDGLTIGRNTLPTSDYLVLLRRDFNTSSPRYGLYSNLTNAGIGPLYGIYISTYKPMGVSGQVNGGNFNATGDGSSRIGVSIFSQANNTAITTGTSYGISTAAYDGATAYGIYAYGGSATTNYAGYFSGNVHVSGVLSKSSGTFKIDHPLDPANKYLQHSFVESPDMMNIYNGNVVTDGNGYAAVTLPAYFDALNKDFRYQLTVIGTFAQAIIVEEIRNKEFVIQTDKPNVKVSWQVTGIRKDVWAEANRVEVEVEKPVNEIGTYLTPELHGQPIEKHLNYKEIKANEDKRKNRDALNEER